MRDVQWMGNNDRWGTEDVMARNVPRAAVVGANVVSLAEYAGPVGTMGRYAVGARGAVTISPAHWPSRRSASAALRPGHSAGPPPCSGRRGALRFQSSGCA